ncbi:MAG: hypothetical protein HEP71_34235 [Roseivirga sp.]|nr:hypothetical protein [Roseivirga sp.]
MNQYAIADSVQKLSSNPKSKNPGWCNANKQSLADFIQVTRRTVINIVNHLEEVGLIERNPDDVKLLRTSEKWFKVVVSWDEYREKLSQEGVKKVHSKGEKSSRLGVKEFHGKCEKLSQPSDIDNNIKDNDIDKGVRPFVNPLSKSLDERRQELIDSMTRQEMHLHHVCRTSGKSMAELKPLIAAWAKENEATQFQSEQHQRNSFKKFVQNSGKKSRFSPAPTPTRMSRPMLKPTGTNGQD